ncbi:MAG TPA: FAD-dependent oxidoreductase, partial [Ferruginibacter sp.]|nr:FAD-dependent oxidoreductase [Ferruginibacter sp.]
IQHIAAEVGIRTGIRSVGKYILTEEDVLQCRKFENAVANASWPIEEWVQHRRVSMRYFAEHDFYQVPATCLQSATINNLFFAGRNISATEKAIASARVMGICLQTGYAAGCLAAATAAGLSQNDAIKQVQNGQL